MKAYLLDTNIVGKWFSKNHNVVNHIAALPPDTLLFVSAVTLGEVHFGHGITQSTDIQKRDDFERWLRQEFPNAMPVTRHTAVCYGTIRSALFKKYPPTSPRTNHPELCFDHASGHELGIEDNDLWIAAQSIEKNLILVSADKMDRIRDAAGRVLDVENWEAP
jgi:tRNA(fMet)-specific endonuclease VapC